MRSGPTSLVLLLAALPALACEPPADAGAARLEGRRFVASLASLPAPPPLNAPFAVELSLCARDGSAVPAPRVDAWMPAHRHGMNYRPGVTALAPGRFRAEGLLFHMPGRWEFVVEIGGERLTAPVDIR
jgi:hypothetical protein